MPIFQCQFCDRAISRRLLCEKCDLKLKRALIPPSQFSTEPLAFFAHTPETAKLLALLRRSASYLWASYLLHLIQERTQLLSALDAERYDGVLPCPQNIAGTLARTLGSGLQEFARQLSRHLRVPLLPQILIKSSQHMQHGRSLRQRREATRFIFQDSTHKISLRNQKILLVDDVYTSGTTYLQSSLCLLEAGAHKTKMLALVKH